MAEAIVSTILRQLHSLMSLETQQEVKLFLCVKKDVKKLTNSLHAIQDVLIDAEQKQLKDAGVRRWLDQLKETSYGMEDVLDDWKTAMMKLQMGGAAENALVPKKKVCHPFPTSCFCFKQVGLRCDIARKIKDINENLDEIVKSKEMFNLSVSKSVEEPIERLKSVSFVDVSEIRGRDEETNALMSKLLCESSEQQGLHIISIVGKGGIGKTTLAQLAYNDTRVINNFDTRMWVCVSDPFDAYRIAKAINEGLEGSASNLGELQSFLRCIHESIARKKFLLVLDNVRTEDWSKWEPFQYCLKNGLPGSKILVTTRKETVARMMESTDIINIKELSKQECWLLFKRLAFFGRPPCECGKLEEIGRKIVGKCKGLPLAAKTMGSLLRFKRSRQEWQRVLDSEMWKVEELEKGLLAPLLLSYNDLPSKIKPCFSYCAVFLKDCIIEKHGLINLWMAQGYLEDEGNKEMEIIGQKYFDYLAARSFFQDFRKDDDDNVIGCKMHDIVHDFARFLRKNECFSIEIFGPEESLINSSFEKVRHSMLVLRSRDASVPLSVFSAQELRSLLILTLSEEDSVPVRKVFDELTCLRALRITGEYRFSEEYPVVVIPKEIEKLIHLRYLQLSYLEIKELPEACCELYNLQTLQIQECKHLKTLPKGIGKLVSLRHLIPNDRTLDYMPREVGRLTCLRTLTEFKVSSDGGGQGGRACNLEGLKHLNHLGGSLAVRGLGNVTDVDEAKKAELEKKKNLLSLHLVFDGDEDVSENEQYKEEISEAILPPPNVETLFVSCYRGKTALPRWLISLTKLKVLVLEGCVNCENMPSLGKLPSLEKLGIRGMKGVKRVGDEFLGMKSDGDTSSSSSSSIPVVSFPKLKFLTFRLLEEWEEWTSSGKLEDIIIMPHLKSLEIASCHKLKALPDYLLRSTTLKHLIIRDCPALNERFIIERFEKETGEGWYKISHVPKVRLDHDCFLGGLCYNSDGSDCDCYSVLRRIKNTVLSCLLSRGDRSQNQISTAGPPSSNDNTAAVKRLRIAPF